MIVSDPRGVEPKVSRDEINRHDHSRLVEFANGSKSKGAGVVRWDSLWDEKEFYSLSSSNVEQMIG